MKPKLLPTITPVHANVYRAVTRNAFCLALACVGFLLFACLSDAATAAGETLYVKVLVARVRQAPNPESPILFKVRRGDPVVVDQKQGDWYHIQHPDGRTGWAHQKLFIATAQNGRETTGKTFYIKTVRVKVLSNEKETVVFQLDGFQPPETFVLKGEQPRVVCDFLNTRVLDSVGNRVESEGSLVKDIRIAPYGGGAPRVRVVLDLNAGRNYEIDQIFFKQENRYIVTVAASVP